MLLRREVDRVLAVALAPFQWYCLRGRITDRDLHIMRRHTALIAVVAAALAAIATTMLVGRDTPPDAASCMSVPKSHERVLCLRPFILAIAREESPRKAIEVAYNYQTRGAIGECHLLAHAVGEELYKRSSPDVATAFAACSDKCVQGCYHGVMAELVPKHREKEALARTVDSLCTSVRGDQVAYKQCVHGIGHGLLTRDHLTLRDAIGMCQRMNADFETDACLDGVFMENMFPLLSLTEPAVMARLPEACGEVIREGDPALIARCLFEVADGLMFYTDQDLPRALRMCEGLRDAQPIRICQQSARRWANLQLEQAKLSRQGR